MRLITFAVALLFATPVFAEPGLTITDAYAVTASPKAKSGAGYFTITNTTDTDDRLLSVTTPAAAVAKVHTTSVDANGVMQMRDAEDGLPVPAGGSLTLSRGGDHLMLMGLTGELKDGDLLPVTLTFEKAGQITVDLPLNPVDQPAQ